MFFPVSKIFWLIAEPVGALILVAFVGVALAFAAPHGIVVGLFEDIGQPVQHPPGPGGL